MHLTKEEQMLLKHFKDMIQTAYQRKIPVYSNFCGLGEQQLVLEALETFYGCPCSEGIQYRKYGGYPDAERNVFCFLPEETWTEAEESCFPVQCIEIVPANKRFCDELSHRDYLGAIMNMGITRDQVGDILTVRQELGCTAYIFCKSDKREMLLALDRIRHTTVRCREVDFAYTGWQPTFQERQGSVASCRLDAVLAVAVKVSRAKGLEMIQSGNVFLNGRCCTENAKKLEEGDILSIRKHGKFLFEKINAQSKKGRYHITIKQYL